MIIGVDKKKLQQERDKKYNEYAVLLNTPNISKEELNALKSELKYLDDQLDKLNGINDKKRTEKLKKEKDGSEKANENNYYKFKSKYLKINNMSVATKRMINVINTYNIDEIEKVKVKVA